MNEAVANIIRDRIIELPFVDKISGMVRTLTYNEQDVNGNKIRKSYPVSCDVCFDDCMKNGRDRLKDLVPDSSKKSVIYFEDNGTNQLPGQGNIINFQSSVRLVCWINLSKIGSNECTVTPAAVASILGAIPVNYFNSGDLVRVKIDFGTIEPKTPAIFSRYTYDETVTQYLLHPFDYFAINFVVRYGVHRSCINEFQVKGTDIC